MIRCPWCLNLLTRDELKAFDSLCRFCGNYIEPEEAAHLFTEQGSPEDDDVSDPSKV